MPAAALAPSARLGADRPSPGSDAERLDFLQLLREAPGTGEPIPKALLADRAFMLRAVALSPELLEQASPALKADREVVLEAVHASPAALRFAADALRADRGLVLAALKGSAGPASLLLRHADPKVTRDREVVLAVVRQDGAALEFAPAALQADREVVRVAVTENPAALRFAAARLRADREVGRELVEIRGAAFAYLSPALRGEREIVASALITSPAMLEFASSAMQADRQLVETAISGTPDPQTAPYLAHAALALRADRALVLAAVRLDGAALAFASPALQADREVVLAAVRSNGMALRSAAPALAADLEIQQAAVRSNGHALALLPEAARADRALVLAAVRADGAALEHASATLRADREVVLAAVESFGPALEHVSAALRADRDVVRAAVARDGSALSFAVAPLQGDHELALLAARQHAPRTALQGALHSDPEFVLAALPYLAANEVAPYVTKALVTDRQRLLAAIAANRMVAASVLFDLEQPRSVLAEAALRDPLVLDCVRPPSLAMQVRRQFEGVDAAYRLHKAQLRQLGIENTDRILSATTLQTLVGNRLAAGQPDARPLAVVVYPKASAAAALAHNDIAALTQAYRVMYFEAGGDADFAAALREATTAQKADLVMVAGLGTRRSIAFAPVGDAAAALDTSDESKLVAASLRERVAKNAVVVLASGNAGLGRAGADNIANSMARVFPQARVLAPAVATSVRLMLDAEGCVGAAIYGNGSVGGYEISPAP